jgi:dihydrofolate synthase / folylpolyglutamate synthase
MFGELIESFSDDRTKSLLSHFPVLSSYIREVDIEDIQMVASSLQNSTDEILQRLYSLQRFGIKPGLERTFSLLESVGKPHERFKSIHIAGTNGKGSVCSMIASILQEGNYKVGLYTSPHIRKFNERISINGVQITDDELVEYYTALEPHINRIGSTFFEVTTAMAFMHYAKHNVDCAVIETGMGGRLDSTNVLEPIATAITSIDFDHQEYLGTSLREIAGEKAGIIKPNTNVIIGEPRTELREVFTLRANTVSAPIQFIDQIADTTITSFNSDFTMNINYKGSWGELNDVCTDLSGKHQARNVSIALEVLYCIKRQFSAISSESIALGLKNIKANTKLTGRIQILRDNPLLIMDVGHNIACIEALKATLQAHGYRKNYWNVVFGVMEDKNYREMLTSLSDLTKLLFIGTPDNPRALPGEAVYSIAYSLGIPVIDAKSVSAAVSLALETNEPTIIVGSFYVADEALSMLEELGIRAS